MGSATPLDARTVQVLVPQGNSNQVRVLANIQNIEVSVGSFDAKHTVAKFGDIQVNRQDTLFAPDRFYPQR